MQKNRLKKLAAATLALLLPATLAARAAAPLETHRVLARPQKMDSEPVARFNPKLRKKKVIVYLRDGRAYKGKVAEVTAESLTLKTKDRDPVSGKKKKRERSFTPDEVALIEGSRGQGRTWLILAGPIGAGLLGPDDERKRVESPAPKPGGPPCQTVDAKLLGREVAVYLHGGGVFRGKLLEITCDTLLLRMQSGWDPATGEERYRTETLPADEIASLDRLNYQRRRRTPIWVHMIIFGLLIVPIVLLGIQSDKT